MLCRPERRFGHTHPPVPPRGPAEDEEPAGGREGTGWPGDPSLSCPSARDMPPSGIRGLDGFGSILDRDSPLTMVTDFIDAWRMTALDCVPSQRCPGSDVVGRPELWVLSGARAGRCRADGGDAADGS